MASSTQIIPQWDFPHEELYLNDNTSGEFVEETVPEVYYTYLAVFAGPKGPDRKLVRIDGLKQHRITFGRTNFKKYGQPHMMPEAYLSNENSVVWEMRVSADDALYANSLLSLWYKADKDQKKFYIKFSAKSILPGSNSSMTTEAMKKILGDVDALKEYAKTALDGTAVSGKYVDDEGYTQVPIMLFASNGRGDYGNNYRWRISSNENYEKEYDMKMYSFQILDARESSIPYSKTATIVSSGRWDETMFINDYVEDTDDAKLPVIIHSYEANIESVYNEYVKFCNEMLVADPSLEISIPELDEFDPFFGYAVASDAVRVTPPAPFIAYPTLLTDDVDTGADDYVAANYTKTAGITVDGVAGVQLAGGDEGAFADPDEEKRQAAIDAAYIKAFSGEYDRLILAANRMPFTRLYDANYDMPVKLELARLAIFRQSCMLYLDIGMKDSFGTSSIRSIQNDFEPLEDLIDEYTNFEGAWLCSVNAHYYYIKEESTGKRVPVTITYYLAQTDASHAIDHGSTTARVGEICQLSGHIKNSLKPSIEEYEMDLKQSLYAARINYFESVYDDVFERATQATFLKSKNSDLLYESNVNALLEWLSILKMECRKNRSQITNPSKRAAFRTYLLEKYEYLIGTHFKTMDIQYTANAYEQRRNITHLKTAVTFEGLSMVMIIEVDVNRRAYEADETEES